MERGQVILLSQCGIYAGSYVRGWLEIEEIAFQNLCKKVGLDPGRFFKRADCIKLQKELLKAGKKMKNKTNQTVKQAQDEYFEALDNVAKYRECFEYDESCFFNDILLNKLSAAQEVSNIKFKAFLKVLGDQ